MAAKKNRTPATAAAQGAEAGDGVPDVSEGTSQAAPASEAVAPEGADVSNGVKSEEERIRENAGRQLATSTDNLATRLKAAESHVSALKGELKKAEVKTVALEKQVVDLTTALAAANTAARNSGAVIPGLPENARQLNECVTIPSITAGRGKGGRHQAKAGDVVMVTRKESDVAALQEKLGISATVYQVDESTLTDLEQSNFLHK